MACDGLRVVLVVSEWPGLGLASGHARPRQARPWPQTGPTTWCLRGIAGQREASLG